VARDEALDAKRGRPNPVGHMFLNRSERSAISSVNVRRANDVWVNVVIYLAAAFGHPVMLSNL